MAKERTELGLALEEGLKEALAWKRGEIALETVNVDPMPPARIKAIRKKAAKSAKAFEARYGIAASTVQNWEQGRRKPDPASRLVLKAIELDPDFMEKAASAA
ncbi:MAG: transcriptional regulator [Rhodovulum sulfidophilum]|uniref:Transcriptional regulator n=1 Tax=Rhodovulum sulfidophilum TaxID=35806 RepID=A0A2W5QED0_RHOSU|nr:MAG: transcriptional regulator [Rhodovulum sulfidophilum]